MREHFVKGADCSRVIIFFSEPILVCYKLNMLVTFFNMVRVFSSCIQFLYNVINYLDMHTNTCSFFFLRLWSSSIICIHICLLERDRQRRMIYRTAQRAQKVTDLQAYLDCALDVDFVSADLQGWGLNRAHPESQGCQFGLLKAKFEKFGLLKNHLAVK